MVGDRERALEVVSDDYRGDGVESGSRLVVQHDVRLPHYRPREAGALLHAARDLRRILVRGRHELDGPERVPDAHRYLAVAELRALLERKRHVLRDRHPREERSALEEVSDPVAHLHEIGVAARRDVYAVHQDLSGGRGEQADEVLERDGLAGSGRTDHAEHFALLDAERDPVQNGHPVELLHDVSELYQLAHFTLSTLNFQPTCRTPSSPCTRASVSAGSSRSRCAAWSVRPPSRRASC